MLKWQGGRRGMGISAKLGVAFDTGPVGRHRLVGNMANVWWAAEAAGSGEVELEPCAPLFGETSVDVAILGGGFTGLWTAIHLLAERPDLSVAIVEQDLCGYGASGRNGGIVNSYSASFGKLVSMFGKEAAERIERLGSEAHREVMNYALSAPDNVWLHQDGFTLSAAAPWQIPSIEKAISSGAALRESVRPRRVSSEELHEWFGAPGLGMGAWFPEGATVQPFRLARALKKSAVGLGAKIYENSRVEHIEGGRSPILRTDVGTLRCGHLVVAGNAWMSHLPAVRAHITNLGSYMVVTDPIPDLDAQMGRGLKMAVSDARMFVNWARTTEDGRLLVGHGAGPLSYGGRVASSVHRNDEASVERAVRYMHRVFPFSADVPIAAGWGGPIDMASDRLPFFGTIPDSNVHYAIGYSGHGVTPTWIGGRALTSLVLGREDRWTNSDFCRRRVPSFPPEPFRYMGGRPIQKSTLKLEDSLDLGSRPSPMTRGIATVPSMLGLKIGRR